MSQLQQQIDAFRQDIRSWLYVLSESDREYESARSLRAEADKNRDIWDQDYRSRQYRYADDHSSRARQIEDQARQGLSRLYQWLDYFSSTASLSFGQEMTLVGLVDEIAARKWGDPQPCDKARSVFMRRAMNQTPQSSSDVLALASYLGDRSQKEEAIRIARQGLAKFDNSDLKKKLAALLQETGQIAESIGLLKEELKKTPEDLNLKQGIAQQLLKAGRIDDAMSFLDTETAKYPQDRSLHEYRRSFLVEGLLGDDDAVRQVVVRVLKEHEDDLVLEQVAATFEQSDGGRLKLRALQVLAEIQGSGATPFLLTALKDRQPELRSSAVQTLARVGESRVLEPIVEAYWTEADLEVREHTAQALRTLDPGPRKWWEKLTGRRPWAR